MSLKEYSFNNHPILPNTLKMLIIGPTNSGKTRLLFEMITNNMLDFNRLIICSASILQPIYQILIKCYQNGLNNKIIKEIYKNKDRIENIDTEIERIVAKIPKENLIKMEVIVITDENQIPSPESLENTKLKTLIIIDDMLTKKQNKIAEFFVYGRHYGLNCIYLSQSFFKLARKEIRGNCNMLIFLKMNKLDYMNLWRNDICNDIDLVSFKSLYNKIFDEKYN